MPERTWLEAAEEVLRSTDEAWHYTRIASEIIERGLKTTLGATPWATVGAALYTAVQKPDAIFERTGKGYFRIKPAHQPSAHGSGQAAAAALQQEAEDTGALKALGMFWRRDAVVWKTDPRLLGWQAEGAMKVDFADQIGVYLLHDRERVIYVGRASRSLGARLKAHTRDRLSGRWDRFSWFGLRGVTEGGKLEPAPTTWNAEVVIDTMEAVLIESLEPPLNRKKGDGLAAIEYLQVEDPEIEKRRKADLLQALQTQLGL